MSEEWRYPFKGEPAAGAISMYLGHGEYALLQPFETCFALSLSDGEGEPVGVTLTMDQARDLMVAISARLPQP